LSPRPRVSLIAAVAANGQEKKGDIRKKPDFTQVTEIDGKSFDQWMKEISAKDPSKRAQAAHKILYFGPDRAYEAVPVLLAELKKHTPNYPIDASVRTNLAISLGMILGGVTDDPDIKYVNEAVTLLRRLCNDSQGIVKYRAAQALENIGVDAKNAVTELIPMVKDSSTWEIRQAACKALGAVAVDNEKGPNPLVLKALYGALNDSAVHVRLAAIQSLTYLGSNKALQADLTKNLDIVALKDSEPTVQMWAHMAIMSIHHNIMEERLNLIMQIATKADTVPAKIQAAQSLGTVGPKARTTSGSLIKMLGDRDHSVVYWSMWALARMESQNAVPMLEKIAADPMRPQNLKDAAKEAIKQLNGKMAEIEKTPVKK
jgi:HEAT repeat protein